MNKVNVFEQCPSYQGEHFYIRKMEVEDAKELFKCYSNPLAAKYFNGDCCIKNFYYTDFNRFLECIKFWESSYKAKEFVRFSIVSLEAIKIIGTVEVHPVSFGKDRAGILRLDLLPHYESEVAIVELLGTLLEHIFEDFAIQSVILKLQKYADMRRKVLKRLNFVSLMNEHNFSFQDYFILKNTIDL